MNKIAGLLMMGLFLSGCASVDRCPERVVSKIKQYSPATQISKSELIKDLKSGKTGIGATLDYIRSTYGDPDSTLISSCTARFIYRLDSGKNITLWFEDGWRLSMWSN